MHVNWIWEVWEHFRRCLGYIVFCKMLCLLGRRIATYRNSEGEAKFNNAIGFNFHNFSNWFCVICTFRLCVASNWTTHWIRRSFTHANIHIPKKSAKVYVNKMWRRRLAASNCVLLNLCHYTNNRYTRTHNMEIAGNRTENIYIYI